VIRLTVLYNLPEDSNEEEFLAWRLGEHQTANAGMPGVMHTDFARVVEEWPGSVVPRHRFMTTVDWPDRESFEVAFRNEHAQSKLEDDVKRIRDFEFYISEILISESPGAFPPTR